jgi:hypothetical protein
VWGAIPQASNGVRGRRGGGRAIRARWKSRDSLLHFCCRRAGDLLSPLARDRVPALQSTHQLNRYCIAEPNMTFTTHNPPNRLRETAIFAAAGAGMCVAFVDVGQSLYMRWSKTGVGTTQ